ncbi:helix-hairpin-helix domain-containing protein, partial [Chryseobacterium gambrini]
MDEDLVEELRSRAKNVLTTIALTEQEKLSQSNIQQELLDLDGMDRHLAFKFAEKEITNLEELAEQSVDDLSDIEELSEEKA